jgi:hypothetical protein
MSRSISKVTLALFIMLMLAGAAAAQEKGANFAGTWTLDKSKSSLPEMMQNIESITMTITQDAGQITREMKMEGGAGGPGGGRGMGMMGGGRPATYKLDGSETVTENPRGKSASKVKWADGGKALEISTVMTVDFQGETRTLSTSERWELIDGGALKVVQKRETPRGPMEMTMVFKK